MLWGLRGGQALQCRSDSRRENSEVHAQRDAGRKLCPLHYPGDEQLRADELKGPRRALRDLESGKLLLRDYVMGVGYR